VISSAVWFTSTGELHERIYAPHTHQPVVEPEELNPATTDLEVHDPRLGLLGLQAKVGQQHPQPRQRGLGLLPGGAQHQRVVGVAHQHPCSRTSHARSSRCS
jgi:hypothetical protein